MITNKLTDDLLESASTCPDFRARKPFTIRLSFCRGRNANVLRWWRSVVVDIGG